MDDLVRRAIELAAGSHPHPNPKVGALVLDRNGTVVGTGFHEGPGHPHAERAALDEAGTRASGGTLVVTLEPCAHHGRTPPCTDAVAGSGVARVVVGAIDPDPRVSGAGIERLRAAGIDVEAGVAADQVEAADPGYFHHRRTGRPFLTLKIAATLDGQTAAIDGSSRWITGPQAREDAHRLRAEADAVLVGAGTIRADDPLLTARLPEPVEHQPVPIVLGGLGPLPPSARIWDRDPIVLLPAGVGAPGGRAVELPDDGGRVDLPAAMEAIAARGMLSVLCEGGAAVAGGLLRARLVDRLVMYVAPTVAGGTGRPAFEGTFETLGDAARGRFVSVRTVGSDVRVEWRPGSGD